MINQLRARPTIIVTGAFSVAGAVLLLTQKEVIDQMIRDLSASPMSVRPGIAIMIAALTALGAFSAAQAWQTTDQYV